MEETPSAIATLFSGISNVTTKIMTLFGTVSTELMKNPLFQITLGIVILMIIIGLVFYFVKKVKRRGA